jgi:hypothetical protein
MKHEVRRALGPRNDEVTIAGYCPDKHIEGEYMEQMQEK